MKKLVASIQEISKAIGMDTGLDPVFRIFCWIWRGVVSKGHPQSCIYLARFYKLNDIADYWFNVVKINSFQMMRFAENYMQTISKRIKEIRLSQFLDGLLKVIQKDSRESPSIYVSSYLLEKGINIKIYDPMVPKERIKSDLNNHFILNGFKLNQVNKLLKKVKIYPAPEEAVYDSDIVAIITKWKEFQKFDWGFIYEKKKNKPYLFDGVNAIKNKDITNMYSLGN